MKWTECCGKMRIRLLLQETMIVSCELILSFHIFILPTITITIYMPDYYYIYFCFCCSLGWRKWPWLQNLSTHLSTYAGTNPTLVSMLFTSSSNSTQLSLKRGPEMTRLAMSSFGSLNLGLLHRSIVLDLCIEEDKGKRRSERRQITHSTINRPTTVILTWPSIHHCTNFHTTTNLAANWRSGPYFVYNSANLDPDSTTNSGLDSIDHRPFEVGVERSER